MSSSVRIGGVVAFVAGGILFGGQVSRAEPPPLAGFGAFGEPASGCGSDSDCQGHGKCSSGTCNHCGSDSDCKTGHCSSGMCGSCGSDSDCKGNGKCSSGQCGSCGSDSECPSKSCSGGHCKNYYP
ncbi:MAG TPA: hypothetical protein VGG39_36795 [Polyangiaceae bacterium]|jgi:hypothetical protein